MLIRAAELIRAAMVVCLALSGLGCGDGGAGKEPAHPGQQTYNRFCFSCHQSGSAGAPMVGDVDGWAPRIAKGEAALLEATVNGIPPGMPPMGLCLQCSEAELAAAIDYMIAQSSR